MTMKRFGALALSLLLSLQPVLAADVSINNLPAASSVTGTDVFPATQGGTTTRKATAAQISTYTRSVTTKSDVGLGNVDNTSDATKNAASVTLTNKTLTAPVINSPTGIVKGDVGLGNVDNTSNATERAAAATLTNKSISGSANTLTNIPDSALSANVPLLNGNNALTGLNTIPNTEPRLLLSETDQGANLKIWDLDLASGLLCLRTRTDLDAAGVNIFCAQRGATTSVSTITIGDAVSNPSVTFLGSGTVTLGGGNVTVTGGGTVAGLRLLLGATMTPSGNGMYSPGTNRTAFSTNGVRQGEFDGSGNFIRIRAEADQSYNINVPTTGFAHTVGNNITTQLYNPAGTLATGTSTMPATPIDGQVVRISSSQTVTTYTLSANSGQTINNAPTTLVAGIGVSYIYNLSGTRWFRLY